MADRFLYFGYGSNMLTSRLQAANRTPSARAEATAFVLGCRLTFDKVSTDGSGKCDMAATQNPADCVHGVLFSIANAEAAALDRAEGLDRGYSKASVDVLTKRGTETAVVYVATNKNSARRPYHWYKALVVGGAVQHGLPHDYIERLRAVESRPDPRPNRTTKLEADQALAAVGIAVENV